MYGIVRWLYECLRAGRLGSEDVLSLLPRRLCLSETVKHNTSRKADFYTEEK